MAGMLWPERDVGSARRGNHDGLSTECPGKPAVGRLGASAVSPLRGALPGDAVRDCLVALVGAALARRRRSSPLAGGGSACDRRTVLRAGLSASSPLGNSALR